MEHVAVTGHKRRATGDDPAPLKRRRVDQGESATTSRFRRAALVAAAWARRCAGRSRWADGSAIVAAFADQAHPVFDLNACLVHDGGGGGGHGGGHLLVDDDENAAPVVFE